MKKGCNGQIESVRRQITMDLVEWCEVKRLIHNTDDQRREELEAAYHSGFRAAVEQLGWKLSSMGLKDGLKDGLKERTP